ncbi:hypothetical protein OC834_004557 [Tilletia horrida]|nr:hypothetical protein OC834_004557 [Tilletia horrida]KAK0541489.1 hypothetical protein OC835_000138 [Tilletia horrida]KAK0560076.1 hypothetical protein OC844_003981 [Tilletia horrida]
MVRAASFLLISAALATAYGHVSETFKQGRVHWKRAPTGQKYPTDWVLAPASSNKPEWLQALNDAVAAGKIPNIPPSKLNAAGSPTYPSGIPDPCNWSNTGCQGKDDIYVAPDGYMGIQFDDGPTPASPALTKFLASNNIAATHFMIGSNILDNPSQFEEIWNTPGQHIAVHTWSHNMSTTLSNEVMTAELGWTMQIIYDKTGKIPSWWRAPMGDLDDRIRAIAMEVFGMRAVNWNADSNDWCMETSGSSDCPGEVPGKDLPSITNYIDQTVLQSPKSPGIIMLEHELTTYSVNAFIQHTWAGIQKAGWKHASIPELWNLPWYANSFNNTTPNSSQSSLVRTAIVPGGNSNGTSSGSSSSSAAAASASASSSGKSGSGAASGSPSSGASTAANTKKGAAAVSVAFPTSSLLAVLGGAVLAALAL